MRQRGRSVPVHVYQVTSAWGTMLGRAVVGERYHLYYKGTGEQTWQFVSIHTGEPTGGFSAVWVQKAAGEQIVPASAGD